MNSFCNAVFVIVMQIKLVVVVVVVVVVVAYKIARCAVGLSNKNGGKIGFL